MSPLLFAGGCSLVVLLALVALKYVSERDDDTIDSQDLSDYRPIPDELIERAHHDARVRDREFHERTGQHEVSGAALGVNP